MKCCSEITSGCLLGATHLCAESQRWVVHPVTFSLHKQDICMFTNEQTQLHLFFNFFCNGHVPKHKDLQSDRTSHLKPQRSPGPAPTQFCPYVLLLEGFSHFFWCGIQFSLCIKDFSTSPHWAIARCCVQPRSQETPGFTPHFPLFWTVSNVAPKDYFSGFPTGLPDYKIINVEEVLRFISMKWLKELLICHDFM